MNKSVDDLAHSAAYVKHRMLVLSVASRIETIHSERNLVRHLVCERNRAMAMMALEQICLNKDRKHIHGDVLHMIAGFATV